MRWFVLVMLAMAWLHATQGCEFPGFMQTNTTQRNWRGRVKEQYTEFTLQVFVEGNRLRSVATDSSAKSFTWVCLNTQSRGRYLVAHEEDGQQSTRYTCVEFVKRSENVIQLRSAPVSRRMDRALCTNSAMELDPWLLVDKTHVAEDEHVCSLQGGFSIRIYDKMFMQGVCDGYQGETRLESECLQGEGLYFYFRQQSCVPDSLYMYFTQRTVCLANWQEGPYTYMLLRHDLLHQYMWLMRYPTGLAGDSFTAYLFKDLVADMDTPVTATRNYLRLDMVPDMRRPVSSLCVDEYEVCSIWRSPCSTSPQMALTCSRTCGLCNATRPTVCNFPRNWQGTWYDGGRLDSAAITTDASTLTVHGQVEEKFWCVDWDRTPLPDPSDRNTQDQMLVAEFHNGCQPRYTCARVMQHSPDVMFIKLSQTKHWPFTSTVDEPVDCSHFSYDHEQYFLDNKFRNKNLRLLYEKTRGNDVECNLPGTMRNYQAQFEDGSTCTSTLEETGSKKGLHVLMDNCPSAATRLPSTLFTCVDSVRLMPSRDLLIVSQAASDQHNELFCWVFPKRPRVTFYLLSGNQCNQAARRRIRNERVSPVITFSKQKRNTKAGDESDPSRASADVTGEEEEEEGDKRDSSSGSRKVPPDTNRRTKPPPPTLNKTEEGEGVRGMGEGEVEEEEEGGSNPGPYVVIAAVLIFALFQIPCLCKSSS